MEFAKGKMDMVTIMDIRVKAGIRKVCLRETYSTVWLIMLFLEVKYIGSLINSYLIYISRKVLG